MNDALNCRIAVSNGSSGSGGFILFPGGQFQPDTASNVATAGGNTVGGLTYVRSAQKWAPVGRSLVAGDGSRYAYPDFQNGGVHLVSLTGGSEVVLGSGQLWNVIDVETDAVYAAVQGGRFGPGSPGLWRLPTDGSSPVQIIDHGSWTDVIGGTAFGTTLVSPPPGAPNPLVKHPLDGSPETTYQGLDGAGVLGVDGAGRPIVETQNQNVTSLSMLLPNGTLATFWTGFNMFVQAPVIADQWGIWFTLNGQGPALMRWTNSGAHAAANIGGMLGSGCF